MSFTSPNPWRFAPRDPAFVSPDKQYEVAFWRIGEIAMSAPWGGDCAIVRDNLKLLIDEHCAAPVVWDEASQRMALPIWCKGRVQQIAVIDVRNAMCHLYARTYGVVWLKNFHGDLITGINSPVYKTKQLYFDLRLEEIECSKQLKWQEIDLAPF